MRQPIEEVEEVARSEEECEMEEPDDSDHILQASGLNEDLSSAQTENKTANTMGLRKTFEQNVQLTDAALNTGGQLNETMELDDKVSYTVSTSPQEVDPAPAPGSLADRQGLIFCDEMDGLIYFLHISAKYSSLGREHRKWVEAAVSLKSNPYSKENIDKRRLSRSSSLLDNSPFNIE